MSAGRAIVAKTATRQNLIKNIPQALPQANGRHFDLVMQDSFSGLPFLMELQ
jgi:hypothetical protein